MPARLRPIVTHLFLFAAYVFAAKVGLVFADINPSATAIWPPTGIAIAAVVILGPGCWPTIFAEWLKGSRLNGKDAILVLSVGGGSLEKNVSPNLVSALQLAKERGSAILGIVGRDGGCTAQVADVAIVIPTVNPANVTPHTEAFQAVVWHLWISHPTLKVAETKWESMK